MKYIILLITVLIFSACDVSTSSSIQNDKLFNGYSYPVEGGVSSTYLRDDNKVIFFYNVKTSNLFSICSGEVAKSSSAIIVVDCDSGEKIEYTFVKDVELIVGDEVSAGDKISELEGSASTSAPRYKLNVVFYPNKDDLTTTLTSDELYEYIHEGDDYEKE